MKVAIFVEGETELVFIRHLFYLLFDTDFFNASYIKLISYREDVIVQPHFGPNPQIDFFVFASSSDDKVLTDIRIREKEMLLNKGFEMIIGLRDMFSETYKLQSRDISSALNNKIINDTNEKIKLMSQPKKIFFFYSIMEIEAWFLGFYECFVKINPRLTVSAIKRSLSINIELVNPEEEFFKPSRQIYQIFRIMDKTYTKNRGNIESIVRVISKTDIDSLLASRKLSKCVSFINFLKSIKPSIVLA